MKKILAVATALVLAISSLCVFVFADDVTTIYKSDIDNSSSSYYDYYFNDVSSLSYSKGDVITLTAEIETASSYASGEIIGRINGSWNASTSFSSNAGNLTASGSVYTAAVSTSVTATSTNDVTFNLRVYYVGGSDTSYLTVKSVTITNGTTGESVTNGGTASGSSTTTASGIIYVNEDYHALLLNGYFISIPHTDDNGDGYCDVCNEYIGSEDSELEVVTIDGVDYYVVFTYDTTIASGNWNKVTVGDSTLAAALNTEGAKLVVTRDTETVVSYADGEYDKFMLGKDDSSYVQLGTKGHTSADEDSVDVDCADDDGYVVTYDGAAVYAALSDAGLADLSSYVLISNTSASYNITSVEVLVPVGTVVGEDVDVSEPAEVGDTTTEDDGEEDADSVDVADNADDAAESNPTTGVVLALVPTAIAGFAAVASKRR